MDVHHFGKQDPMKSWIRIRVKDKIQELLRLKNGEWRAVELSIQGVWRLKIKPGGSVDLWSQIRNTLMRIRFIINKGLSSIQKWTRIRCTW